MKSDADHYRYFPEPDLLPIEPPASLVSRSRSELPEAPAVYTDSSGAPEADVRRS